MEYVICDMQVLGVLGINRHVCKKHIVFRELVFRVDM